MRTGFRVLAIYLWVGGGAWARADPEHGALEALHSRACLSPHGTPGMAPCDGAADLTLVPVAGGRDAFMIRRQSDNTCLYSNRDQRFGWYACTPEYADQHWTWRPAPGAVDGGRLLRAVHSGKCLFSNADGRFGLYACTPRFADQRWRFAAAGPGHERQAPYEGPSLVGDWQWSDGARTSFHRDGSFATPDDGGGRFRRVQGDRFELIWPGGRVDQVMLSRDGMHLLGSSTLDGAQRRVSARRTGAPPAPPPQPPQIPGHVPPPAGRYECESAADCVIFCASAKGCCPSAPCGCTHAMRRDQTAAYQAEYARTCERTPHCPAVGCALREAGYADCQNGRCVPGMLH